MRLHEAKHILKKRGYRLVEAGFDTVPDDVERFFDVTIPRELKKVAKQVPMGRFNLKVAEEFTGEYIQFEYRSIPRYTNHSRGVVCGFRVNLDYDTGDVTTIATIPDSYFEGEDDDLTIESDCGNVSDLNAVLSKLKKELVVWWRELDEAERSNDYTEDEEY